MIVRETHTPKPEKPFEQRPTKTISIDEVLAELGTQEPYHQSYFYWINPENTVTLEDITALYQHQYGENFIYHTPSTKSNSIWFTQYPPSEQHSSQCFEIPIVCGGNKR